MFLVYAIQGRDKVITTMVIRPLDDLICPQICGRRFATPRFGVCEGRGGFIRWPTQTTYLQFQMGTFRPPGLGLGETWGMGLFGSPPMGSY